MKNAYQKKLIEKKYKEIIKYKKEEKKHTREAFFVIIFFVSIFVLNMFFDL
ncbi:hypothetical protein [Metabacillus sp. SLBN-84]